MSGEDMSSDLRWNIIWLLKYFLIPFVWYIIERWCSEEDGSSWLVVWFTPTKSLPAVNNIFRFRWDYFQIYRDNTGHDLEGFKQFIAGGVRSKYLESVFPAESFPAWQTIQTGELRYPHCHTVGWNVDNLNERGEILLSGLSSSWLCGGHQSSWDELC